MKQKRILSVQDISCFGKCANTVALPVISAGGAECAVLPTALLSTHTGGFEGYSFLDLTAEMHKVLAHWQAIGIQFDMLYTGYFGSVEQLTAVKDAAPALLRDGAITLVDPVLGDGGKLYSIYDSAFVDAMRDFVSGADIITPNMTEACLLADIPYAGDAYDDAAVKEIFSRLAGLHIGTVVITGVRFCAADADEIGVVVMDYKTNKRMSLSSPRIDAPLHGTGDVFASALAVYLVNGFPLRDALTRTIAFVTDAIKMTSDDLDNHWYGVRFEESLHRIAEDCLKRRMENAVIRPEKKEKRV